MVESIRGRAGLLRWVLEGEKDPAWYLYLGDAYLGQIVYMYPDRTYGGWYIYAGAFGLYGQHEYKTARLPAAVLVQVVKAQLGLVRA